MAKEHTPDELNALDTEDVAALLGVSARMVRNYVKEKQLPCSDDPRGRRFVWKDVLEWYVRYRLEADGNGGSEADAEEAEEGENFNQACLREKIADADLKELKLARERGETVSVHDAQKLFSNVAKALQTKLLGMPAKMAGQVTGLKDKSKVRDILDREVRQICNDLATIRTSSAHPEPETETIQ